MKPEEKEINHAYCGSDWAEHEDYLVGNRIGLLKLRESIDEALEKGESSIEAGEFIGTRCLENDFFENEQPSNLRSQIAGWLFLAALGLVMIAGFKQILTWLSA